MKQKKCRLLLCIALVGMITAIILVYKGRKVQAQIQLQEDLAQRVIRFHVRANSDSDEDQRVKLRVKEAVITYLEPLFAQSESLEESRRILTEQIPQIEAIAKETLDREGHSDSVTAYFERSYFPAKMYADVVFPPGEYEAFRIDIGVHEGKNWWCVLYPPLCFVDGVYGELPDSSKEVLKNVLTADEYRAITEVRYQYRWKYLTFLNRFMN